MALARILFGLALAAGVLLAPSASLAQPVVALQPIATGLARPVAITHAGDGSGRLFITLQGGQILVYDGTQVLPTPFLDISDRVMVPASLLDEFGLFSVAFHPQYATNGFFYVHYASPSLAGEVVIARYRVTANPNVADHDSELILLTITHNQGDNHWGGQLQFGPDGFLYVAVGDGGEGGDPEDDAQHLDVLLGKLLRLDVDASPPYIPASNPFVGTAGARGEIWAYGLRNPWRFAFDRATGDLFIGDVGQATREEIDFQPATSAGGENYGWNRLEGTFCFNPAPPGCNDPSFIPPILELDTTAGNCSIIGGYRYRGRRFPPLRGFYLYADFCMGQILGATRNANGTWTSTPLLDTGFLISTFGEDQAGELYLAQFNISGGAIHRIVMPGVPLPAAYDFDRDGKADVAVYRSVVAGWFIRRSTDATLALVGWGAALLDLPFPGDYDGDGTADVAVYRPSTGEWFIRRSSDGGLTLIGWGSPVLLDLPVPGDYDGDGLTDVAVYRQSTGEWFIRRSSDGALLLVAWGAPALNDVPVPADYQNFGKLNVAVYRKSTGEWFIRRADGGLILVAWGSPFLDDVPVAADFDGDGKADVAVYRRSTGEWFVRRSLGGLLQVGWGSPFLDDVPAPADYDGDEKADIAVYRRTTGEWLVRRSTDLGLSLTPWGAPTLADVPLAGR